MALFTNPSARAGYDTRSIFKRSLTGLNSEFSFSKTSCLTMAEEPSLSYYLPIAGGRIIGFIPFPRVLVLCEMQSVSSRIWTRIAVFISYGDNDYTTGTSKTIWWWVSNNAGEWHYMGGPLSRRSFCLFWYDTKQRPELEISTRPEVDKGTPEKELEKGTQRGSWRRKTQKSSRQRTAEETSRHEIGSRSSGGDQ